MRLALFGEIMAAADFDHDQLYIEYVVRFEQEVWDLQSAWPQSEPGMLKVGGELHMHD